MLQAAGYCLIEVNPSVNRGGAQVQRLVGEATQSQRVALAGPAAAETADAAAAGPAASPPGGSDTKGSDSKPAKKPSAASSFFKLRKPAADSSANQPSTAGGGGKSEAAQTKHGMEAAAAAAAAAAASEQAPPPLTLLLFEEVDNLQEEDRGFIATLQELLATSKVRRFDGFHLPLFRWPLSQSCAGLCIISMPQELLATSKVRTWPCAVLAFCPRAALAFASPARCRSCWPPPRCSNLTISDTLAVCLDSGEPLCHTPRSD